MMTRWRKWAAIPGLAAIAALATAVSAWSGASNAGVIAQTAAAAAADTTTLTNAPTGPWAYRGASSPQGYSPDQPIKFPHPVHVQKAGMNCQYCHFAANKSPDPGMPAVGTCMGCHNVVKTDSPEIKKLASYWNPGDPTKSKPVPWIRIHKVPDYVNFPHMRHVNAGVTCQSCHGQVQKMTKVFQYASLNMGWCVNCHVNGYDPAKGVEASGYQQQGDGAWKLTQGAPASGSPSAAGLLVATAHAQAAPGTAPAGPTVGAANAKTAPGIPGGTSLEGPVKKARYDCATCHY